MRLEREPRGFAGPAGDKAHPPSGSSPSPRRPAAEKRPEQQPPLGADPHPQEGAVQAGGLRPLDAEQEVAPGRLPRAPGAVLVGDVHAAEPRDLVVHQQQLAVVAEREEPAPDRVEETHLGPGGTQRRPEGLRRRPRAPGVDEDHHPHAPQRGGGEAVAKLPARVVGGEDVHLEKDAGAGAVDRGEHGGEGRAAVAHEPQAAHRARPIPPSPRFTTRPPAPGRRRARRGIRAVPGPRARRAPSAPR